MQVAEHQLDVQLPPIGTVVLYRQKCPYCFQHARRRREGGIDARHLRFHNSDLFLTPSSHSHLLQHRHALVVSRPLARLLSRQLRSLLVALPRVRHVPLEEVALPGTRVPAGKARVQLDYLESVLERLLRLGERDVTGGAIAWG